MARFEYTVARSIKRLQVSREAHSGRVKHIVDAIVRRYAARGCRCRVKHIADAIVRRCTARGCSLRSHRTLSAHASHPSTFTAGDERPFTAGDGRPFTAGDGRPFTAGSAGPFTAGGDGKGCRRPIVPGWSSG